MTSMMLELCGVHVTSITDDPGSILGEVVPLLGSITVYMHDLEGP